MIHNINPTYCVVLTICTSAELDGRDDHDRRVTGVRSRTSNQDDQQPIQRPMTTRYNHSYMNLTWYILRRIIQPWTLQESVRSPLLHGTLW